MSIKICLDPGHGGSDPGAVNGVLHESSAALAIAKKVGALLEARGVTVKYTRTADKAVTLEERCKISNAFGADAFISIHLNSAENKTASGIETWRYSNVDTRTKKLAENVQTELIGATRAKNRGVKTTSSLYVLKHTTASAVLIECGFISNNDESKKLFTENYQNKIASAIVSGIYKSLA